MKHFQRPGQRINQQVKVKKCVYFSPPFQTFGCANQGQISLVNETHPLQPCLFLDHRAITLGTGLGTFLYPCWSGVGGVNKMEEKKKQIIVFLKLSNSAMKLIKIFLVCVGFSEIGRGGEGRNKKIFKLSNSVRKLIKIFLSY